PVAVVRLPLAREKALNVVLNNRDAQGCFDPDRLAAVLAELEGAPEFALTGFDAGALAALRLEPDPMPDAGPELSGRVEVTLVTDDRTYSDLAPRLDALVGAFGLIAHVRRF
ncbi:MAG: hypothetical protein K2V38_13740, partial [Gemmataceae bacterium]|nr:hypothetical protein [Gemmataceae bacterium]